jgi:methylenetetrahydrofolate dehydrogenase (NADP+)/methenyltetrahydrofolate cyclohydrolase
LQLLDGKKLSEEIKDGLKLDIIDLKEKHNITAGLAVILVGSDPASQTYVNMKSKACKDVGIYSVVHEMPESISEEKILQTIDMMNNNPNIHGILVQLPLPKHIKTSKILETIKPSKDVDGFHPFNMGRLILGLDTFAPATPFGVMRLLAKYNIELEGKNVVIVGASNIVGKPLSALFLNANATVSTCHIYTKDLSSYTKKADILCVGVGKAHLINRAHIKKDVVIVDIGINRLDDGKLVGDVDFEDVKDICSSITPVPGGVGPMTIACLLKNTIECFKRFNK